MSRHSKHPDQPDQPDERSGRMLQPQQPNFPRQGTQNQHGQQGQSGQQGPGAWRPSVEAPPMPSPAHPQRGWVRRHKVLSGLLLMVAAAVAMTALSAGSDSNTAPTAGGGGDQTQSRAKSDDGQAEPAAKQNSPGLGVPVRDGKFELTVTKVSDGVHRVGPEALGEKAQGQFVLVRVTVKNVGDESQLLDDSSQVLRDGQGRKFEADSMAAMSIQDNDVFHNEINPGNTVKGTLVYDMPKGAEPASIELHDSMFSGGVTVSLR